MNKDYTNEQIKVAVDKYFEVKSSRTVIEVLGYPTATSLLRWLNLILDGRGVGYITITARMRLVVRVYLLILTEERAVALLLSDMAYQRVRFLRG